MQEMTNFSHPIELRNEELDLVAAGGGHGCGCRDGGAGNGSLNVLSFDPVQVNVGILSNQQNFSSIG